MAGVRIEHRSGLGNVLVATREFQPREAVVHERPLLHVPGLKPSNQLYRPLQAYFEQHKVPPSVVLKIMAYVTASTATQASVLRCFCPDVSAYADAAVVQQARAFAACLLQHPPVPEFAEWAASCSQQETDTENLPAAGQGRAASDTDPEPESESFESAVGTAAERQMQREHPVAFSMLMRVWLIWVMNGHSFQKGSALFDYGSKLTHTCACPNTMYRTAAGAISSVVESVDGSSGSSSGLQQPLPPGGPPVEGGGTAAAGAHLALQHISTGDLLTTNYLGMGHKRLMSTPARQSYLQDKFLFKCTCHRCTAEVDLARGIPCPSCSGPFRSADKLLSELEALPGWQMGQPLVESTEAQSSGVGTSSSASGSRAACSSSEEAATSSTGGATAGRSDGVSDSTVGSTAAAASACWQGAHAGSSRCGYIYCDMAALLAGAAQPWKCDVCGAAVADDTLEVWGRFYTKSHAKIESDMEGWVMRLDQSMDTAPLVRDPSVLHERVLSVVRLLGPRHWASWRLLLLGVELHCGALEEASIRAQLKLRNAARQASQPAQEAAAAEAAQNTDRPSNTQPSSSTGIASEGTGAGSSQPPQPVQAPEPAAAVTQLAVLIVRYCRQLWVSVSGVYGEVEAGQVLGYHFSEACQVLLQVSSTPGFLPQEPANALVDAALQLQMLVLPGVRSIMGPTFNPLGGLLGQDILTGSQPGMGADAAAVAAAIKRQQQQRAADAEQMTSLVRELRKLEAAEGL